jgi:hypothetical protein
MTREQVAGFLISHKDLTKEEVVAQFTTFALLSDISIDKLGSLIKDIRSYPEWIWGE